MKIYFTLEVITAFLLLFLFSLYFVETGTLGSLFIAAAGTFAISIVLYYKFFKNRFIESER